ncbi:DUF1996 domain-containing protein [Streptomyces chromofuscus]|uniref:DUF1996 domain-containing protein n=1 Tax=Streptomyces chromofuscus TaxID=42881 RepID=A0A7M2TCR1_STRCW|nr:DUF1996 domain-containing protein [Streptomyces chromofuscus]QOV46292.1 DUF1996 domain-containing protein [Streptomyces chromofuscus]GGS95686.1 hypothetical protein GCM10010254_14520 [Streptomyces chromofuscus]
MGRNTRKRRTPLATKAIAASAALALGGGGLIWANFYASAHEESDGSNRTTATAAQVATIDCPDVGQQLSQVPDQARGEVDGELATLDQQITEAYQRLATTRDAQAGDGSYVQNTILGPLEDRRQVIIDRIQLEINRAGGSAPEQLDSLSPCTGKPAETTDGEQDQAGDGQQDGGDQAGDGQQDGGDAGDGQNGDGQQDGNGGQAGNGPVAADFQDITTVQPNSRNLPNGLAANGRGGSRGSFTTKCGTNSNDNHNTDNVIVAPGVTNGAHHLHDYVGNQSNDAFASDDDLAAAQTTCQNQGDKSSYFWPVLRLQDGSQDFDQNNAGGGTEGNVGRILEPKVAQLKFVGNRTGPVVAMPRALRIITGDAKAFVNGLANANTAWTCTGFEDRQLTDKYPLCPEGSDVVRLSKFQSCWDGQNIDSANHRTHVAFVQPDGTCPSGFQAIPQLQVRLVYEVPTPTIENGVVQNPFAVDTFPEQLHKPITDHNDFINFFSERLMNKMVNCINTGRRCA